MKDYLKLIKKYKLNEVKEQKEFLTNPEFLTPNKPLVLAGGTGFGKTFTTILKLIMFYDDPKNKGKKTIILPASTKVLRNNFSESMGSFKNLPFSYEVADGKRKFNKAVKSNCDVIIVLPQTIASIKSLPKVEWLIVDESHKWYFAKTITTIINKCKPTYQLLLTGTPFKFNARKDDYTMFYVPVVDMFNAGNISNPMVEIVSSSVNLKDEDYEASSCMVRTNLLFSYKQDKDQLVTVAKELSKILKTRYRKNTIGRLLSVFGIDKTIIYCYSKKQARHFYKTFQSSELSGKVLLSDSESDVDSTKFAKFKKLEDYRVLLVVDRGKEGFDMPELFNIVDFTLSTNPEIILQILGRLFRISKLQPNKQKMYYKVASLNTAGFIKTLMTGVLKLMRKEEYQTFDGNFKNIKIPVMPNKKIKPRKPRGSNENNFSTSSLNAFNNVNIPLTAMFWNEIKTKHSDVFKGYAQTTLSQVLSEMSGKIQHTYWTFDECKKEAEKYKRKIDFLTNSNDHYQRAYGQKWLKDITSHMKPTRTIWTIESATKKAKKYKYRGEFFKNDNPAYNFIKRNNLLDELFPEKKKTGAKKGSKKSKEWKSNMSKAATKRWKQKENFKLKIK